jgi:hypothetical protein
VAENIWFSATEFAWVRLLTSSVVERETRRRGAVAVKLTQALRDAVTQTLNRRNVKCLAQSGNGLSVVMAGGHEIAGQSLVSIEFGREVGFDVALEALTRRAVLWPGSGAVRGRGVREDVKVSRAQRSPFSEARVRTPGRKKIERLSGAIESGGLSPFRGRGCALSAEILYLNMQILDCGFQIEKPCAFNPDFETCE